VALLLTTSALAATGCLTETGALPIYDPGHFCMTAALLPVRIDGAPDANPPIWGIASNGSRVNLMWPPGFTLRMDAGILEVLDTDGNAVARQGELLVDAGGGTPSGQPNAPFAICQIGTRLYTSSHGAGNVA
jgi:hypothetical protein